MICIFRPDSSLPGGTAISATASGSASHFPDGRCRQQRPLAGGEEARNALAGPSKELQSERCNGLAEPQREASHIPAEPISALPLAADSPASCPDLSQQVRHYVIISVTRMCTNPAPKLSSGTIQGDLARTGLEPDVKVLDLVILLEICPPCGCAVACLCVDYARQKSQ